MLGALGRHDASCRAIMPWAAGGPAILLALLVSLACTRPAYAETLEQALSDAYLVNPVLNAERARLRAVDEQVALAKSGLRPFISGSADVNYVNQNSDRARVGGFDLGAAGITTDGVTYPRGYSVQLSQPLFEGFQNINAIRQAKATVQAARESLRSVEQTILLDAASAYVNVVRDTAVVKLRENDVSVLSEQLKATKDRFDVGEVTRTDVAQAEARRAEALATLAVAQANLKTSRAAYEQVIGHPPGDLVTPPSIRHLLPAALDESMTLGDGENPVILAAVYDEESSLYAVEQIMGELLPEVTLEAQYQKRFDESASLEEVETTTVTGRVNVPFYQGGSVSARVRQAKETNNQLKREVEDARLRIHADVIANWGILQSSGPAISSAEAAVSANKIALTGVREEEKVGQRTTLDVLDAQRELLNSQIGLVSALRDRVVAEYSLYAAIGRMDAQTLGLPVPYYDPIEHYDIVKGKWFGLRPPPPPAADN
ncbi:MAG: TolC family outer membrane protein [Methyloceanibacter sp.]